MISAVPHASQMLFSKTSISGVQWTVEAGYIYADIAGYTYIAGYIYADDEGCQHLWGMVKDRYVGWDWAQTSADSMSVGWPGIGSHVFCCNQPVWLNLAKNYQGLDLLQAQVRFPDPELTFVWYWVESDSMCDSGQGCNLKVWAMNIEYPWKIDTCNEKSNWQKVKKFKNYTRGLIWVRSGNAACVLEDLHEIGQLGCARHSLIITRGLAIRLTIRCHNVSYCCWWLCRCKLFFSDLVYQIWYFTVFFLPRHSLIISRGWVEANPSYAATFLAIQSGDGRDCAE